MILVFFKNFRSLVFCMSVIYVLGLSYDVNAESECATLLISRQFKPATQYFGDKIVEAGDEGVRFILLPNITTWKNRSKVKINKKGLNTKVTWKRDFSVPISYNFESDLINAIDPDGESGFHRRDKWTTRESHLNTTTGISFRARSSDQNVMYFIQLKMNDDKIIRANFAAKPEGEVIDLNWTDFKVISRTESSQQKLTNQTPKEIAFGIESDQRENRTKGAVTLELVGGIDFQYDLSRLNFRDPAILKLLEIFFSDLNKQFDTVFVTDRPSKEDFIDFMSQISANLYDTERQKQAIDFLNRGGAEAVKNKLEEYGFGMGTVEGRATILNFWNGILNQNIDQGLVSIPKEVGEFGLDHGEFVHHLQTIAMLDGIADKKKKWLAHFLFQTHDTGPLGFYPVWNLLFDAPGDRLPNSPRFWVRLMEEMWTTGAFDQSVHVKVRPSKHSEHFQQDE